MYFNICSMWNFSNVFVHFALGQQFSNILIIQYFPQIQIILKCCSVVWQFLLRTQELCNSAINAFLANLKFIDLFLLDTCVFLLCYVGWWIRCALEWVLLGERMQHSRFCVFTTTTTTGLCWGLSRKTRSAGTALRPLHHRGAHNVHGNISIRIAEFVSEIIALIAFN